MPKLGNFFGDNEPTRADEHSFTYHESRWELKTIPQSHWELGVYYWENFYSLPYQGRFWFMIEKNFAHFHTQKLVGTTHFHTKRLWLVGRRLIIGTVHKKLSLGASGISLRKCLLNSIPKARWNHSPAYQTTLIGRPKGLFANNWHCSQKALLFIKKNVALTRSRTYAFIWYWITRQRFKPLGHLAFTNCINLYSNKFIV